MGGGGALGFLRRAVAFFERYGIKVERLLTDNAPQPLTARIWEPLGP
jgi:hypothetical protein